MTNDQTPEQIRQATLDDALSAAKALSAELAEKRDARPKGEASWWMHEYERLGSEELARRIENMRDTAN